MPRQIWDINVDHIVMSKVVIGYIDKTVRLLVLIMPKMSRYVGIFKFEEGNNKSVSFRIDDKMLLEKYKAIWTKIKYLKISN